VEALVYHRIPQHSLERRAHFSGGPGQRDELGQIRGKGIVRFYHEFDRRHPQDFQQARFQHHPREFRFSLAREEGMERECGRSMRTIVKELLAFYSRPEHERQRMLKKNGLTNKEFVENLLVKHGALTEGCAKVVVGRLRRMAFRRLVNDCERLGKKGGASIALKIETGLALDIHNLKSPIKVTVDYSSPGCDLKKCRRMVDTLCNDLKNIDWAIAGIRTAYGFGSLHDINNGPLSVLRGYLEVEEGNRKRAALKK
jgi:hypothetical protein